MLPSVWAARLSASDSLPVSSKTKGIKSRVSTWTEHGPDHCLAPGAQRRPKVFPPKPASLPLEAHLLFSLAVAASTCLRCIIHAPGCSSALPVPVPAAGPTPHLRAQSPTPLKLPPHCALVAFDLLALSRSPAYSLV